MRSTALLTSALATGALANVVTSTVVDVVTTTLTVYVTDGYGEPDATVANPMSKGHTNHHSHHHYTHNETLHDTQQHTNHEPSKVASTALVIHSSTSVNGYPVAPTHHTPVPMQPASSSAKASSAAKASSSASPSQAQASSASSGNYGAHMSGPKQADLWSGLDYQAAMLYHHNAARANHNAAPLQWDASCEANARIAGEKCIVLGDDSKISPHYIPEGANQGQNLWAVMGTSGPNATAGVTESWYKGELPNMAGYWGQKTCPSSNPEKLHFTALVWKGTTHVGCASVKCGDGWIRTFCNYSPAGNIEGYFDVNVEPPEAGAKLGWWSD